MKVLSQLLFDYHNDCVDTNGEMICKQLFSYNDMEAYRNEVLRARLDFENEISEAVLRSPGKKLTMDGYSDAAHTFVQFEVDLDYSNGQNPNFRERLVCPITKLNNRQRFISCFIEKRAIERNYSSIFIFEQSTPVYKYISGKLLNTHIFGSEYLGHEHKPGQIVRGLRHEDPTALTFDSASFDMVITCDILPNVPDLDKAVREISRVTGDGGTFIFTTPFTNQNKTVKRAKLENNKIVHLEEPRFYYNHLTGDKDSIVFYDIGWDLFDMLKEHGFKKVYQLAYYSATYGYLGDGYQSIFVAEK